MSGIPALTVELDGGLGWADISEYVLKDQGLTMKRGRSSEFDTSSPGTLSLTLRNDTPATQFGIGGSFDAFGYLKKNTPIRVKVGSTQVWQGKIDSWVIKPGRVKGASVVEVEATDGFKDYAKLGLWSYGAERTYTLLSSTSDGALYPLTAPPNSVGSTFAALRDPTAAKMEVVESSRGDWKVNSDGPAFVGSSVTLEASDSIGPGLRHFTTFNPAADYAAVGAWFRTDETVDSSYIFTLDRWSGGVGKVYAAISPSTGLLVVDGVGDSGGTITFTSSIDALADDVWHHLVVLFAPTSGTTITVYLDGANIGTANSGGTGITVGSSNRRLIFGARNISGSDYSLCMKNIAVPYCFKDTSAFSGVSSGWAAGRRGDGNISVATRISRTAAFAGESISTSNLSGIGLDGQDLNGKSLLDALQEIAATEHGIFYFDRLGSPRFRGYNARFTSSSVVLTVSAVEDLAGNLELVLDDATYANTVEVAGPAGTYVEQDAALVSADGIEIIDRFDTIATSLSLQDVAERRLEMRSTQQPRLGKVVVDLLTSPNSIESTTLQLLPLDRVRVDDLDADMFGATTYDGFVEGWELNVSTDTYAVTLDLSPVI